MNLYTVCLRPLCSKKGKGFKAAGKFTISQPIILYRKFTADYIFNGRKVLTHPQVLITDEAGVIIDIVENTEAGDGVERLNGLLTPGFINAHCHLELSHLKGFIRERTGLVDFVQLVMNNRISAEEMMTEAMMNAEAEMYQSGIVAVGDICNTADSLAIKAQSKLLWHNFIEVSGFTDALAVKRLENVKTLHERFQTITANQKTTYSPHAPYSVSKTLFQLLNDETAGQLITIHNQECAAENDLYRYKTGGFLDLYQNFKIDASAFEPTGKSSFQSWMPSFTKDQSIISVHNTFISEEDLGFSAYPANDGNYVFYCLCGNANRYIEDADPPVDLLRKANKEIVIGTDSYASNHHLDMLEEIKTLQAASRSEIPLGELLKWATINGAKALQMDASIGSFECGKKPGIVLIEGLDELKITPQTFSRRIL